MLRVQYSTNGDGRWHKRVWAEQCPSKILFGYRCQGVQGHKGEHWCYAPDGSYRWGANEDEPRPEGMAGGMTPPGHKRYRSPVRMAKHYYMSHYTDSEVTDSKLIRRLEAGECPKGATVVAPVDFDDEE